MPQPANPQISVLICSHQPRVAYLSRVLEALRTQTFPVKQWELLLIDNGSTPPLAGRFDLSWHPRVSHLREEQLGKTRALLRGIAAASSPNLVTVDDDNVLAPDYLENASAIAGAHPKLGVWGGNVALQFEHAPPEWTRHYWPFLAERSVSADAMACNLEIAHPLPVGAGCCVRKEVAEYYAAQVVNSPLRLALGRTGNSLMAGEDTDLVMTACEMGLARGLFKSLQVEHLIPPERLQEDYLVRLVEGIQFCSYILGMLRDPAKAPPPITWWWRVKFASDCLIKFGRKRRFYKATKRAQKEARKVYETLRKDRLVSA